ncbi:hypothetical protein HPP92_001755 [Vanilla planifolia]|uniref:Uncharacterized protein n=1 Tax=Vanilla planifolia TaxID=51239 RepID=A0A835VLU8_VANPL|nr:hypothetical protein HPP92_001980 [Vanilla planifolia]KAG0501683.1 hypothetical protein HPP92_001755 [Vanilla planifolia]
MVSSGLANEAVNQQNGAAAVNEIGTVHELFTFSPLDGPELTSKGKVGPIFEKPNTGSLSNLKLLDVSEHGVQMIIPREKPKIWKELSKHLSQPHSLAEQRFTNVNVDDSRSTQSSSLPLQESRKDLHGLVYQKTNAIRRSNSKVNNPDGQLMLRNLSKHLPMVHEKVSDPEFTEVKELSLLSSKRTSRNLGSVLQSLQQARSSIKRELAKQPSLGQGTLVIAQPSNSPVKLQPIF